MSYYIGKQISVLFERARRCDRGAQEGRIWHLNEIDVKETPEADSSYCKRCINC
jgi:hypothetical protein